MTTGDVARQKFWKELRVNTQARIGLDRAGNALHTRDVLDLAAAHAAARDAVHVPLDTERLTADVGGIGLGTPTVVTSQVGSRAEYLRRPDLGRLPSDLSGVLCEATDIGFVLADGLSPTALMRHGVPLVRELALQLGGSYTLAAPVIATQARVALGDHIAARGRYRTLIVIIGERPGLSVVDSLGIYLTHLPRPGCTDADRNCISNIHPPDGLSYREAAHIATSLVSGARRLGRSGVSLKDTSRAGAIDDAGQSELC
ncbi:ethanolamine ammonia-lyase subunit EutC [Mycobacteroides salmoniphilum]|uniref:ethanolamine ammonia-lyase subunit EutC n=1 Tax=Mycobacteroides salmoniphilum TaxID=404941 RepID=UPI000992BCAB|nr:ethanolamine ammonia-lyase subunit EutC [Mycobacteroides salmoniphilum]